MSPYFKDLVDRVGWTAVQAACGVFVADALLNQVSLDTLERACVVAAAAVAALLKGIAAKKFGNENTASFISTESEN